MPSHGASLRDSVILIRRLTAPPALQGWGDEGLGSRASSPPAAPATAAQLCAQFRVPTRPCRYRQAEHPQAGHRVAAPDEGTPRPSRRRAPSGCLGESRYLQSARKLPRRMPLTGWGACGQLRLFAARLGLVPSPTLLFSPPSSSVQAPSASPASGIDAAAGQPVRAGGQGRSRSSGAGWKPNTV